MHPQLPVCAYCSVCKLDGWMNEPKVQTGKESERPEEPPNLYECTVCLDILHPECAEKTIGKGQINTELSNSWECAKCINSGYSSAPSRAGHKRPAPPPQAAAPQAAMALTGQQQPPPSAHVPAEPDAKKSKLSSQNNGVTF